MDGRDGREGGERLIYINIDNRLQGNGHLMLVSLSVVERLSFEGFVLDWVSLARALLCTL